MSACILRFLGTAACDFSPLLGTEFRDRYDLDARRSSAMLMNGRYLVDAGTHILDEFRVSGEDPAHVTDLFLTHFHSDHFNPEAIAKIAAAKPAPLRLWIRRDAPDPRIPNTEVRRLNEGEETAVNGELSVMAVAANHDPAAFPQHFLFVLNGKRVFYGCDGGWFLNAAWRAMKNKRFDLMALDGTCGDYAGDFRIAEHNSVPMIRLLLPSLRTIGATDENTVVWISHLAPSLHRPHRETETLLAADGVRVAYDGATVDLL